MLSPELSKQIRYMYFKGAHIIDISETMKIPYVKIRHEIDLLLWELETTNKVKVEYDIEKRPLGFENPKWVMENLPISYED